MKRVVTFTVLLIFLHCQYAPRQYTSYYSIGNPVIISEMVGEVIDLEERNRYDLFRGIEGFQSARFYTMQEGGLIAKIETSEQMLAALNHDSLMQGILKEYIDNHEWVKDNKDLFERKWKIVDYDTIGFPITKNEIAAISIRGAPVGCGCVAASCIGGGTFLVAVLTALSIYTDPNPPSSEEENRLFTTIFVVGAVAAVGVGTVVGVYTNRNNREEAMEIIKESRVPRIVE